MGSLFEKILKWWLDLILWLPRLIFETVADIIEVIMASIPVPEFFSELGTISLPSEVLYFTTLSQAHIGVGLITGALLGRFAVRRLPFVG